MQFAETNGVVIHYQEIGAPKGKPVLVFANSLGTDFRIWRDVIVRLAGEFRIFAYDKRGHGLSDVGDAPYAIEDHVWDLAGLLDHVGVEGAYVCGLSVGGMIAQGLHQARPELIKGLILCDTAHKIGTPDLWQERIDLVENEGMASLTDAVMARWFTENFRRSDNLEYHGYRNMFERQDPAGYAGTCAAIANADMTAAASDIDVPTLCICGEDDLATPPELVRELSDLIDGSRFELIEDAGHLPCVEKPDRVADLIKGFVEDAEKVR